MSPKTPSRFIGLDIHKQYSVFSGVDADLRQVCGPRRVSMSRLKAWAAKHLSKEDAVVIEMTTNTWAVYDQLAPLVHSVTVAHPPHVALVTRAQVKTDAKAALNLAQLLAVGLIDPVWVPPQEVRDLRALIAQRSKMVRLSTQAKNRLHAVLHRRCFSYPSDLNLFSEDAVSWWLSLPLSQTEQALVLCDLASLSFAHEQIDALESTLTQAAAEDARVPFLIQLPGFSLINSLTVLAAIGVIERFEHSRNLVGYAGLGSRIHASGKTFRTGRITKSGRRDLRTALVQAAQSAANTHPHWQNELARLAPRLGRNKAIVAIARKLLIAVWHVLTNQEAARFTNPQMTARKLMQHAYRLGKTHRPQGFSPAQYVRFYLDKLNIGSNLDFIQWTKKRTISLPPSSLSAEAC